MAGLAPASSHRLFGEYLSPQEEYRKGQFVQTWTAPLTSIHTQLDKDARDYAFCTNNANSAEPPSRWTSGRPLFATSFDKVNILEDVYCRIACKIDDLFDRSSSLEQLVRNGYHQSFVIDYTLPSAARGIHARYGVPQLRYAGGFPVGFVDPLLSDAYVYNHLNLFIDYNIPDPNEETYTIVGFAVEPLSIKHELNAKGEIVSCPASQSHMDRTMINQSQVIRKEESILYTYDVIWRQSDVRWSDRWDVYLSEDHLVPMQVHAYSIANSIIVLTVMCLIAGTIWIRRIRRAAKLTLVSDEEDTNRDVSAEPANGGAPMMPGTSNDRQKWRLVHGDVFRPPAFSPMILAVSCGIGAQLLSTAFLCSFVCVVGLMTQIHRLTMVIGFVVSFALVGSWSGGYTVARVFQQLQIEASDANKQIASGSTATLSPALMFMFWLSMTGWKVRLASPFAFGGIADTITILLFWVFLFVPSSLLGSRKGFDHEMRAFPVETSETPRDIPERNCFMCYFCPIFSFFINGVWPFGVFYVEWFFINTEIWMSQYYDFYFSLMVVLFLMVATCACQSILTTYWQLSRENHRWWWTSFRNGASSGTFVFVYSIFWYASLEPTGEYSMVLYFGSMTLVSIGLSCALGCVSLISSLWFNRVIYAMITASA